MSNAVTLHDRFHESDVLTFDRNTLAWVIQAVLWRKTSLFVVQLVVTMIYVVGIVNTLL